MHHRIVKACLVTLGLAVIACKEATAPPEPPFAAISAGFEYACAIHTTAGLMCWGSNSRGQLGSTTTEICTGNPCSSEPRPVSAGKDVDAVAAGGEHTCALDSIGAAYCWGSNRVGQLGTGSLAPASTVTPQLVAGNFRFDTITAGAEFTCGLTGGQAYCWGANYSGQFGTGDTATALPRPTLAGGGRTFRVITAGSNFTCGIAGTNFYCWGENTEGQLGSGDFASRLAPAEVTPDVGVVTLASTSSIHMCGIDADGEAYCWGQNVVWELGIGPDTAGRPNPTLVATSERFRSIAGGGVFSCGIALSGTTYCWGAKDWGGEFGMLGTASPAESPVPVPVAGGHEVRPVVTGWGSACGVTTAGHVYCWGQGYLGALGNGSTADAFEPTEIVMP